MSWPKGVPRPLAVRLKISRARKKAWADPLVRARMSEARKKAWARPGQRQKQGAAISAGQRAAAPPELRSARALLRGLNSVIRKRGGNDHEAQSERPA